ncbi:6-phospho-3-hexuloisomerase [Paenisporosarcina antarctica]|uniref:6-phospho-3-hexuloisomerase n=1 Tax=Paenisporosarcina antarctica TaxID=417367 RepID=A0A4P6ZZG0_9BACL|nr:6-phospho-3-hexuloisomerase [Paenisporosarcina antarctica]QBP41872.1 6-phospho-3-hexuloisomerase [Paenisporosarcina antarctica]
MRNILETVTQEIKTVLAHVNETEAIELSELLVQAKNIFVFGEGRSGLMGKAFAMRLMHGGFSVYVVGETTTPSIQKDDLLVVISGSGSSAMITSLVETIKKKEAVLALVTTNREAKVSKDCQNVLHVPAATKYRKSNEPDTIQPLGNQFDQSVHLLLDSIIIYTLEKASDSMSFEEMKNKHTNME